MSTVDPRLRRPAQPQHVSIHTGKYIVVGEIPLVYDVGASCLPIQSHATHSVSVLCMWTTEQIKVRYPRLKANFELGMAMIL